MVYFLNCLFFHSLIAMKHDDQAIPMVEGAYRTPITTVEGLRTLATCLSSQHTVSQYDVQPSALIAYFSVVNTKHVLYGTSYTEQKLHKHHEKNSDRYFKIVEQVIDEIRAGKPSALQDCLQQLYRLPSTEVKEMLKEFDGIKSDYKDKRKTCRYQVAGNACFGLTMIAVAVGIGLEIWALAVCNH